ncbi:CBS domain-containing protein [Micromonospora marina]|uniref:CBS domain-containing protein n=1 Tax=Micromonospora marina TaxID=307120 RepID=A0A1C4WC44_9ACTN|nr:MULTISPECIES: CBS domain-containing protein [Micromonospora]SCE93768.1 CBS domain-containing protein [Micromonospora marina]
MDHEAVRRLPVLDDLGRLTGIVTRGDLLRVHLRTDADIRAEVVHEVLRRVLSVRDGLVTVQVRGGEVTTDGRLDRRSAATRAAPVRWGPRWRAGRRAAPEPRPATGRTR